MNKILFVGGHYDSHLLQFLLDNSKHGLDFAANNLQEAIIKGLYENNADYRIISFPFVGSFPIHSKTPFIKHYVSPDKRVTSVGYTNVMYFKRWDIHRRCWFYIRKWCDSIHDVGTVIFYNFSNIDIAKKIKRNYPKIKIVLIVTDLPEYMSTDRSLFSRINDALLRYKSIDYHNFIDGYVLIAEKMAERMPISGKPQLLMEGIYNSTVAIGHEVDKEPNKVILYTGTLGSRYGIKNLLDAFRLIKDKDYRLWIRGNGQCEDIVKNASKTDSRIVYYEKMSREELLILEKKATLLINPVCPSQEFTSYFFPSKTLEYMASGTPTLMHDLECIPKDYRDYIFTFNNENIYSMKERIVELCEKNTNELREFGAKASKFIVENKTPQPQIAKLLNFVNSL